MRSLENKLYDQMHGYVTYELPDGRYVRFTEHDVRHYGIPALLEAEGFKSNRRVPVYQDGKQIGTIPELFDPEHVTSRSFLYDPRPGDFVRERDGWKANSTLGPGDLSAVPGFQWDGDPLRAEQDVEEDHTLLREAMLGRP